MMDWLVIIVAFVYEHKGQAATRTRIERDVFRSETGSRSSGASVSDKRFENKRTNDKILRLLCNMPRNQRNLPRRGKINRMCKFFHLERGLISSRYIQMNELEKASGRIASIQPTDRPLPQLCMSAFCLSQTHSINLKRVPRAS